MPECQRCLRTVTENEMLTCLSCKDSFHYKCLNMTSAHYLGNMFDLKRKWKCDRCSNVTVRKEDAFAAKKSLLRSPTKSTEMDYESSVSPTITKKGSNVAQVSSVAHPVVSQISGGVTLDQISQLLDSKLDEKLDSKLKSVEFNLGHKIKQEFDKIRTDFSKSLDFLSGEINDVKNNVTTIESRLLKLESENAELKTAMSAMKSQAQTNADASALKNTIVQLHSELNERDQATLMNDVEITGVPEFPGESVMNIVTSTAAKIGVQLDARDVVVAVREGASRGVAGAVEAEGRPAAAGSRPRRIVVRLARQVLRDDLLRATRVRRNVDTSDLGLPHHVPVRLYINERLTRVNRVLLGKAREAKRELGWKFVWTKEGRIYTRRDDTPSSRAQRLRNEEDLERIFGIRPKKQGE